MCPLHRRPVEIETLAEFDELVRSDTDVAGWEFQNIDLTGRDVLLRQLRPAGALFLGCRLHEDTADWLRERGALIFPEVPDLPFDPYRASLYTGTELYAGLTDDPEGEADSYAQTPDARVYAWWRAHDPSIIKTLAQSLHDHAIDDALEEWVDGRRIVGVMGGHAIGRNSSDYRAAAALGRRLARQGFTVATGGGPGAMEAANLGARFADLPDSEYEACLAALAEVPTFADIGSWARVALDQLPRGADSGRSLGIPTWFYGHEPPNPFASAIAKYFRNAIREDILLSICNAGIVFLPGAAGTVQEIFQLACKDYYADPEQVVAMVLVDQQHWADTLPAMPLLEALAQGRPMADRLHLVDSVDEVSALLETL